MKAHQAPVGLNDEWLTPLEITRALGPFDLDPCSPSVRPWDTAKHHFSLPKDGLFSDWLTPETNFPIVWCNPPFKRGEREKWMKKMAIHGNGMLLIPAATETKAFFECVWTAPFSSGICFLKNRPHFHYVDGSRASFNCGTAICIVAYGETCRTRLLTAQLGKFIDLRS